MTKQRNLAMLADENRTLRLYGIVGDDWDGFTDDSVAMLLDQAPELNTIRINSPGGYVYQGMAIHSMLAERQGLTVKIDGLAASMGSVIAMAGERVEMARGAMMMIHNPWNIIGGDAEELRKQADLLDQIKSTLVGIYARRSGQEEDIIAEMMDDETWLTAEEAIEWGFVDAIMGEEDEPADADLAASHLAILPNVPTKVAAMVRDDAKGAGRKPTIPAQRPPQKGDLTMRITVADGIKVTPDPNTDPGDPGSQNTGGASVRPADPPRDAAPNQPKGDDMTDNAAQAKALQEQAVAAERERAKEIRAAVKAAKLTPEFADELIDAGTTVDEARAKIIDAWAAQDQTPEISGKHGTGFEPRDEVKTRRDAVAKAILHRFDPKSYKIDGSEPARQYAGLSLREIAREMAEAAGVDTKGMTPYKVAQAALTHTSSDFPLILENVVGKSLLSAYEMAPRTFTVLGVQSTLPDYKEVSRVQLGEAPVLQKVLEGGEYQYGTVGDAGVKYQLIKYGKILSLTAETIINDDLGAFTRVPSMMGAAAGQLESQLFWDHFLSNPTMADGTALFHTADHGNLASSGAAISIDSIGAGRSRMRQQKGLGGDHFISVQPAFLVVPTALETKAEQFVSTNLMPTKNQDVNVFANRLQVVAEPRLDVDSTTAWYLWAMPRAGGVETIEYAFLEGEEGPQIETQDGFDVDGVKIKVRHSFGVRALDWRGMDKNPGT